MTTRRGFMQSILALGIAPAIVRADSLMRVVAHDITIIPAIAPMRVDMLYGTRLLTIDQITKEALLILEENITFTTAVNRTYDRQFADGVGRIYVRNARMAQ